MILLLNLIASTFFILIQQLKYNDHTDVIYFDFEKKYIYLNEITLEKTININKALFDIGNYFKSATGGI